MSDDGSGSRFSRMYGRFSAFVESYVKPLQIIAALLAATFVIIGTLWSLNLGSDDPTDDATSTSSTPTTTSPPHSDRPYITFDVQEQPSGNWTNRTQVSGYNPTLTFVVSFRNLGTNQVDDVTLLFEFDPDVLQGIPGSAMFATEDQPEGIATDTPAWTSGINIGSYAHGGGTWVTARAILRTENLPCGESTVVTRASFTTRDQPESERSNEAIVTYKNANSFPCRDA